MRVLFCNSKNDNKKNLCTYVEPRRNSRLENFNYTTLKIFEFEDGNPRCAGGCNERAMKRKASGMISEGLKRVQRRQLKLEKGRGRAKSDQPHKLLVTLSLQFRRCNIDFDPRDSCFLGDCLIIERFDTT